MLVPIARVSLSAAYFAAWRWMMRAEWPVLSQAFSRHKLHELLTEYTAAADERGILRMVVAGELKLLVTTPAGFASLRRAGFQQKPRGLYDTVFMLVRSQRQHGSMAAHAATRCAFRWHRLRVFIFSYHVFSSFTRLAS